MVVPLFVLCSLNQMRDDQFKVGDIRIVVEVAIGNSGLWESGGGWNCRQC